MANDNVIEGLVAGDLVAVTLADVRKVRDNAVAAERERVARICAEFTERRSFSDHCKAVANEIRQEFGLMEKRRRAP